MATSHAGPGSPPPPPAANQVSDRSYRDCLKVAIAAILVETGFDGSDNSALETVTEMLMSFLSELGRSSRAFTELACRHNPLPADLLLALTEMGQTTQGLREYAFRSGRKCLGTPAVSVPPKTTSILHTGDRKRHRPGGIVPENFVEFPDGHSYTRTPTHKQPITDYKDVREKAASQKRDVERALTRFIAKTGKTHSLFRPGETNHFPLISCDRTMPDQPRLPAYVSALLFKDQIFEEDESEYAPKKKKEGDGDDDDEDEEGGAKEEGDEQATSKEAKKEEVVVNPFLKPVRMPRQVVPSKKNP